MFCSLQASKVHCRCHRDTFRPTTIYQQFFLARRLPKATIRSLTDKHADAFAFEWLTENTPQGRVGLAIQESASEKYFKSTWWWYIYASPLSWDHSIITVCWPVKLFLKSVGFVQYSVTIRWVRITHWGGIHHHFLSTVWCFSRKGIPAVHCKSRWNKWLFCRT